MERGIGEGGEKDEKWNIHNRFKRTYKPVYERDRGIDFRLSFRRENQSTIG
jgi:hypothetical protein